MIGERASKYIRTPVYMLFKQVEIATGDNTNSPSCDVYSFNES